MTRMDRFAEWLFSPASAVEWVFGCVVIGGIVACTVLVGLGR